MDLAEGQPWKKNLKITWKLYFPGGLKLQYLVRMWFSIVVLVALGCLGFVSRCQRSSTRACSASDFSSSPCDARRSNSPSISCIDVGALAHPSAEAPSLR